MISARVVYIFILLVLYVALSSALFECPPNSCKSINCAYPSCSGDSEYRENVTTCGCCPGCITIIPEGGSCMRLILLGGPTPTSECAKGLLCKDGICQRI